jgi:hypothetical protein
MQAASPRYLVLTIVLLAAAGLYAVVGDPVGMRTPRWPDGDAVYGVDSWTAGPMTVDTSGDETHLMSRAFRSEGGTTATLTLVANRTPKLYAAGPEVPFLGSGYTVEPAPSDVLQPRGDGVGGLVAQRGSERWLLFYAYGERRGLLGNGPGSWGLSFVDSFLGQPNDYYKLYLIAPADQADGVADLAHDLFPRIAAWYATA